MDKAVTQRIGIDFRLDDEVAMVTGAASGIGQAIAVALGARGAGVGLVARPGADFSGTMHRLGEVGARALPVECDVVSESQVAAAVVAIEGELGPLTLGVNAAGIADAAPAEEMPLAQWQRMYDVDVTGVFLCCQAQGRSMLRNGRGSILNIASMSGTIANRGLSQVHYNSAKAAVAHLTKSLAVEWADRGVRVNALSPGYTATPMNIRPEVAEQVRQFVSETPMQRLAEPSEIAGPAVFLLSSAASFCTGVDLLVDGGFCCW